MEIERKELMNDISSSQWLFEGFYRRLLLVDLGLDRETLIFQIRYLSYLIGYKYVPPQGELSSILIFPQLWTGL